MFKEICLNGFYEMLSDLFSSKHYHAGEFDLDPKDLDEAPYSH